MMTRASGRSSAFGVLRRGGLTWLAALAGTLAILMQGAVPIAQPLLMPAMNSLDGVHAEALAPMWGAFCGGDQEVAAKSVPSKRHGQHGAPVCPFCQAVQHAGLLLPPAAPGVAAPLALEAAVAVARPALPSAHRPSTGVQARAPPAGV